MSRYRSGEVKFACSGCEAYTKNCPGHTIVREGNCSDSYEFFMDGQSIFSSDENVFHAMMKTMAETTTKV